MDYKQRRKEQGMDTERAILKAAEKLCRDNMFDKVSIRDICKEAGITTGAFYHHFNSKDDLLTRGFAPMDVYMEGAIGACGDMEVIDRLLQILKAYAQFFEERGWELVSRYYQRRLSAPEAELSMDPSRFTLRILQDCLREAEEKNLLDTGVTADGATQFFFRHCRGVVIDWVLHRGGYPLYPALEQDCILRNRIFKV